MVEVAKAWLPGIPLRQADQIGGRLAWKFHDRDGAHPADHAHQGGLRPQGVRRTVRRFKDRQRSLNRIEKVSSEAIRQLDELREGGAMDSRPVPVLECAHDPPESPAASSRSVKPSPVTTPTGLAAALMPDAFSVQGIENLGVVYERWKAMWRNTAKALAGSTETKFVLSGDPLFIGYIINSYNVYGKQPIADHRAWMERIPERVRTYLSEKHCRNGLVEQSWKRPLQIVQDYGRLPSKCQELGLAIFELDPLMVPDNQQGTRENIEKSKEEFAKLSDGVLKILSAY